MGETVEVRPVATLEEAMAASALLDRIWGERRVMGTPLLWAMANHGGQVLGAFDGATMVGALVGLVGLPHDGPVLHSHITGVEPGSQHRGIGLELKRAQRAWCLERGIERVTWTFDPMVGRNAYFNLVKLGAVAERFHRDYYGQMQDAFNAGDRSDRLEVVWELGSDRARNALGGSGAAPARTAETTALVANQDGQPVAESLAASVERASISVPTDYHALRGEDPDRAEAWRDAVGNALAAAFGAGFRATGFTRDVGYLLERP